MHIVQSYGLLQVCLGFPGGIRKILDLASGNPLPQKYKDHQLTENLNDFRECRIEPDWLLMYQIFENELILSATATGSHSDLFGK